MTIRRNIVWFRRDLRISDHPALVAAIENSDEIIPVFILDKAQIAEADLLQHAAELLNGVDVLMAVTIENLIDGIGNGRGFLFDPLRIVATRAPQKWTRTVHGMSP